MNRVFFSTGEASGDAYAARLAAGLLARGPLQIEAVGGRRLAEAGAKVAVDSSGWGAVGIVEAAKIAPKAWLGSWRAKLAVARGEPGVFVPVDFGLFNIVLARFAKRRGWKVVYFIPPSSWRRDRQGSDIPQVSDVVITPFSWSAVLLRQAGCDARWFGHPLKQLVRQGPGGARSREAVAVLPGSRTHEVENNLPLVCQALRGLGRPVVFAAAPTVSPSWLMEEWARHGGGPASVVGTAAEAFLQARAAVVCSGTATLEAALCDCPMVVVYQGSRTTQVEARIRRPKIRWIGLPNILLERDVVPELILWHATPDSVRHALEPLLSDSPERQSQLEAFVEIEEVLGPSDALDQSVGLIWDLLLGTRNGD